jgi:uncharacterized membrane protein YphA (DoxX/SURF4 family)
MTLDVRIERARLALKLALGLTAFLAGLDKFFNLLAVWPKYLSPAVVGLLPVSPETAMYVVGVIEMIVGLALLGPFTRIASLVACAWLLVIAANLVLAGGFLDVAVRDIVMAIAAGALSLLTDAHESAAAKLERPAARSAA